MKIIFITFTLSCKKNHQYFLTRLNGSEKLLENVDQQRQTEARLQKEYNVSLPTGKENVLLTLRQDMHAYSPALQKLGEYIVDHAHEMLYLTITELARESATSEATVTRLCRQLGCKGYTEFRMALALEAQPAVPAVAGKSDEASELIEECINALRDTGRLVDDDALEQAAARMHRARRIALFGVAASATVGEYFHYKLLRLGKPAQMFSDAHRAAMNCVSLGPEDLVIAISSSGSTRDVIYIAEQAQQRGCPLLVLSNTSRSPLAQLADSLLVAAKPEGPFTAGALNSKVGVMLLIELVIMKLMKCDPRYQQASHETASITLPMLL